VGRMKVAARRPSASPVPARGRPSARPASSGTLSGLKPAVSGIQKSPGRRTVAARRPSPPVAARPRARRHQSPPVSAGRPKHHPERSPGLGRPIPVETGKKLAISSARWRGHALSARKSARRKDKGGGADGPRAARGGRSRQAHTHTQRQPETAFLLY
jgi:hypothetical protein